jgi:hypothetical protein
MSSAPISRKRFVNATASSSLVGPSIGQPQIVLTVPFTLIPASCAFLIALSASAQYSAWSSPEFFFMCVAEVDTIIRMRSGPTPAFFSSIARSTPRSRIVIAVSSTSSISFARRLLVRIAASSSSESANCGIPFGLPRFVTSMRR